jgi:hypothetical protein
VADPVDTSGDGKQHHSWEGEVPVLHGRPTEDEQRTAVFLADKEAEEKHRKEQLAAAIAANNLTKIYVGLTLLLALISALGTGAAWYQGYVANKNARSADVAARAAKSAADTANDTLKEMRTGQGAQDTHTLAEAAKTQASASTKSANAAESAANTAKATLEAQSSPWLGIEKDDADFVVSRGFQSDGSMIVTVTIRLHNYGSAPALDVNVYVPQKTTGGKYSGAAFFHQSNVCTEPEQAERDVQARELYGVEHIIWPSDHRDFTRSINTTESPAAYFPGCISYRGHSDSFQHISFIYDIDAYRDPMDPTPTIPKVRHVTLVGLEPLEQHRQP